MYNCHQTHPWSFWSFSPSVSMICCGSLAASTSDSVISNVQIGAAALIRLWRLLQYFRLKCGVYLTAALIGVAALDRSLTVL